MENGTEKRKMLWTADATEFLLYLWEENMDGLRGVRKNTHICQEMADEMASYGPNAVEVKNKIENLTKKYRKELTRVGPSGGAPSTWKFFDRIKAIPSCSKAINSQEVMIESVDLASYRPNAENDEGPSNDNNNNHKSNKRKNAAVKELLEIEKKKICLMQGIAEELKNFNENTRGFQKRVLKLFERNMRE